MAADTDIDEGVRRYVAGEVTAEDLAKAWRASGTLKTEPIDRSKMTPSQIWELADDRDFFATGWGRVVRASLNGTMTDEQFAKLSEAVDTEAGGAAPTS